MVRIFVSLLIIFIVSKAGAQCMLTPIELSEKIKESELVIEGVVAKKEYMWDKPHHNIYTIYAIDITKAFKGALNKSTIKISSLGGTVGLEMHRATNEITLTENEAENTTNGSTTIYKTIELILDCNKTVSVVYPNPFNVMIWVNNVTNNAVLRLIKNDGKDVWRQIANETQIRIPTRNLSKGSYVLQIIANKKKQAF